MLTEVYFNGDTFSDILSDIQSQFKNTNNEDLLRDLVEIFKVYIFGAWKSLFKDNFYLSTANGDSLDLWGYILGINRYFPKEATGEDYNYFNFDNKRFYQMIFYNPVTPEFDTLSDDSFREILLLLLQKQYISNNLQSVNNFLNDFFSQYGGIRLQDSTDMIGSYVWFLGLIPDYLVYYISFKDILPRAACLGQGVGQNFNRYFGFETGDVDYDVNYVGAFYNTNFIDVALI